MKIAMIAAMAKNRIIGADNDMPWHLPADLKHFKSVTLGKAVIMGRKTYESIGRALPGRPNIVMTSNKHYTLNDATVVNTQVEALEAAKALGNGNTDDSNNSDSSNEVMIIGGGTIYEAFLPAANTLYLTFIDLEVDGDTQFPDFQSTGDWVKTASESHEPDEKNKHSYTFVTFQREVN